MSNLIKRQLQVKLPPRQSAFLWGPRKVGKSTYLKQHFADSLYFDLLKTDLFLDLTKSPQLLREQILASNPSQLSLPIIIDEVQKVPTLLDEVHWLIENHGLQFILCGSSARKVKRGHANLLGGRAWKYHLFPLVYPELTQPVLLDILNQGTIPAHHQNPYHQKNLQGYVEDYLKEEVFAESLTRNISAFSRFFESIGYSHGQMTNFNNIARDVGIDAKTIKEYYQILVDTLVGYFLLPYAKKRSRDIIRKTPKFYLFDVGVANHIIKRNLTDTRGDQFGQSLEHYIFTELKAYSSYSDKHYDISYWRTKTGLEVDFILGQAQVAIEVKSNPNLSSRSLTGLQAFIEEHHPSRSIIVTHNSVPRQITSDILVLPWDEFLKRLWQHQII